MNKMNVIEN